MRRQAGFSLAETLVATALLAVALTSLAHLLAMAVMNNAIALHSTVASVLAAQKVEQLRALTWKLDDLGLPVSDPGLARSPSNALQTNTLGYVDYLDVDGVSLGAGADIPADTAYIRRWSIEPLPGRSRQHPRYSGAGHQEPGRHWAGREGTRGCQVPHAEGEKAVMTQKGFSLVEMVVATAILLVISAAIFGLMNPARGVFGAQVEALDVQQRLRAAVDMLNQDLLMAGAGADSEVVSGPLGRYRPVILPSRAGRLGADPAGSYFTDRITVVSVPRLAAQTTVREAMTGRSAAIRVNAQSGCPPYDGLCRFETGMNVVVFDDAGWWDTFRISNVDGGALHLDHGGALKKAYGIGAVVAEIASHTYWLRAGPLAGSYQLMRYDGQQSDLPIADNVVALAFEYYGDPAPPLLRPGAVLKTSYGPLPPAIGFDEAADGWSAGENCAFFVAGGVHVPRLAWAGVSAGLTRLSRAELTDGPWCPDAAVPERYDADLLRIRRVRVTLRMRAQRARDRQLSFDVAIRNLNLER